MKSVLPISLTKFVHTLSQPECNITCPDGYTVFDDCSGCELTDICLAETPCLNGGTCYIVRAPNDYRCDCPEATEGARCEGGMSCLVSIFVSIVCGARCEGGRPW